MAEVKKVKTLEVEEDLAFQQAEWRVSRVMLVALLLVMLATGLGLFSGGPLSRTRVGDPTSPLWVEHDRFGRFETSTRWDIHASPQADGSVRFTVSRSILDAYRVTNVTPNPDSARVVANGVEYRFGAGRDGAGPVILHLQPEQRWLVQGELRSPEATVRVRQFIYP